MAVVEPLSPGVYPGQPQCPHCGQRIPAQKKQNKFCNHSCAASINNRGIVRHGAKAKSGLCSRCSQPILGVGKKFCSLKCANSRQSDELERKILGTADPGEKINPQTLWKHLIKARGEQCEECGWNKTNPVSDRVPLEVHHRDGDHKNNRWDNLKLLCPNCHSLTSTFRNLNKGKGREHRRNNAPLVQRLVQ